MKIFTVASVFALPVMSAFTGETTHLQLDCRQGALVVDSSRSLVYDASWYVDGVMAKVTADGVEVVSGVAGTCIWSPSSKDVHHLELNVYDNGGVVVGTENVWMLSREDLTDLVIPEGTTEIGAYAFRGGRFTAVTIPSSMTNIASTAFEGCVNVTTVTVPSSLNVAAVFADSRAIIANVIMTGACDAIPPGAYEGCAAIKTVVLERADKPLKVLFPDAYRTIENLTVDDLTIEAADFFEGCESLVDVDVPEDCELYSWTFKESKFDGDWWIEKGWVLGYAGETGTSLVLPDELTKFGGGAFDGNEEIEEVTFGEDTEVAGGFSNCPELQIVNFGGSERRIGAYAFWGDT